MRTTVWWARDKTGNPFLLVMKMLVGMTSALTGSPVHRSISSSDGRSAVNSRMTQIFLLLSHRVRNLFHLHPVSQHEHKSKIKSIYFDKSLGTQVPKDTDTDAWPTKENNRKMRHTGLSELHRHKGCRVCLSDCISLLFCIVICLHSLQIKHYKF